MVSFDDLIPQQKKPLPSRGRTLLEQGLQGATFNLADEATNRIGAGLASLVTGEKYGDLLNQATDDTKARLAQQLQDRPALSIGAQIGGALLTGGAGATTKGGAALANSLRGGNLVGRAIKAGALGAASGSAAGFGAGSGLENRLDSAGDSAVAGGLVGGAIPVVGSIAGKVGKQFQKIPAAATSEDIKALSNAAYKKADESGGVLKGWFTNRFLDDIADIQPATVAGKRIPTDPKLDEALNYINGFKNTRLTLQDAQNLDEYLGEAIDGFTDSFGKVNKSGRKLLDVQSRFRNSIENADDTLIEGGKQGFEALKEGRALWSAQLKLRDIERIVQRAELTQNPSTAIQTGFRNLLTNAKKSKGYTKEELAAIEKAAKTGIVTDILKTGGSRLVPIIAGASGGGVLGTAAAGAGAAASRGIATRNAMVNAENVARAVSNRVAPQAPVSGGLPAIISNPRAGQLAAPVGAVIGGQSQPTQIDVNPNQPNPYALPEVNLPKASPAALDFNDLIPQGQTTVIEPLSYNSEQPALLDKIKQAESAGDPNAKNPLSSASGLYQLTDATFRSAVDKFGRKQGIKYSDKNNPQVQEFLAGELTKDNARILQNKGIEPSDANLYFAHFLGAPAASKAISLLGKNAVAARSFPDAAKANPTVFFEGQRPRTIDEVYQLITSKVV